MKISTPREALKKGRKKIVNAVMGKKKSKRAYKNSMDDDPSPKGGTLNKNGTPKSVCSFATSCPNFGKSSCGLLDMEDLFLSTNVTSEKKKVANLFSSRQNLLKQQQQYQLVLVLHLKVMVVILQSKLVMVIH